MAKPEWSWSEKDIQKALEGFKSYLQSGESKKHIKQHNDRQQRAQELLKDGTTIDRLNNEQLAELLRDTDAFVGNKKAVGKIQRGDAAYITKVKDWLKRLIAYGGQGPLPVTDYLGVGYASELLTMRFPDRFYLLNNASRNGINKLGQGRLPTDYSEWRPLFEYLRGQIEPIVQQELGRPADFYDVDLFLWWLARRKDKPNGQEAKSQMPQIWRVAPGEGGEWWNECRENGCIVIGWSKAAEKAPKNDFRQLSEDDLEKLFEEVYKGGEGAGGHQQVWRFVHEIQPGDIIVAKRGTKEILGIGIVTSDCIPPGHPDHPLGNKHEFRHARKVDWRITESVQVDFNLGGQTVVRENRWDDIVKAYRAKGIVWDNGNSSSSSLVCYFEAKGFQFTEEQVTAFYAALKTKGFVILSGLSGTGKTKLAQLFAELLCPCEKCQKGEGHNVADCDKCTHLFLSVRPDWRDSKALLGYYNPLTKRYESTPLLKFLLRAAINYEPNNPDIQRLSQVLKLRDHKQDEGNAQPYFVILDEMNLAHVEYYFADFLSVLESGRDEKGWTKESLRLERIGNLPLPPNLYIIGTVNIDETTYMFSPKVLDRAFTLEFREVNFGNYPPKGTDKSWTPQQTEELRQNILEDLRNGGKFCAVVADKNKVKEALQNLDDKKKKKELEELNGTLQPYDLHFGYRVLDEIALFVQNATQAPDDVVGKLDEKEEMAKDRALDYAVLMKVLPKFHGPRQKLETPLREVLKWAAKDNAPEWAKDTSKPITLEQITEALQKWERLDATQQQTQQEARQGADRQAEQTANAQQEQGNQTETTPTQAAQGEAKGQSEASTAQRFKSHFRYANTAKKVLQMLRQLYETGFASFAQ
jgi:energy-coupling factor transporter ATP-binding protein EcfA2